MRLYTRGDPNEEPFIELLGAKWDMVFEAMDDAELRTAMISMILEAVVRYGVAPLRAQMDQWLHHMTEHVDETAFRAGAIEAQLLADEKREE
jgi:hypothetical protein